MISMRKNTNMPQRNKTRRLWLQLSIQIKSFLKPPFSEVKKKLIQSIDRGDYVIPVNWIVIIYWRNKEDAPWRSGFWTQEMLESARSSDGWDKAVRAWIARKRELNAKLV